MENKVQNEIRFLSHMREKIKQEIAIMEVYHEMAEKKHSVSSRLQIAKLIEDMRVALDYFEAELGLKNEAES